MIQFTSKIWLYPSPNASWHFITVPAKESELIKLQSGPRRGWGARKVSATIGKTTWTTSIFPDKTRGYLLPLKAEVRKKEKLSVGETVSVGLNLL